MSPAVGIAPIPPRPPGRAIELTADVAATNPKLVDLEKAPPAPGDNPVVLVVLDGARWQEIFRGADTAMGEARGVDVSKLAGASRLMPNLQQLIEARGLAIGAPDHGEPMTASGVFVSLPGYLEIFTGARTKCVDNDCPPIKQPTIVDEARDVAPSAEDVAVVASWPNIENAAARDLSRITMSTGSRHNRNADAFRLDRNASALFWAGELSTPWPGEGDYRPDALTAQIALKYLAKHRPQFLFVGLGDMDEYAHKNDYRGYVGAMQQADKIIGDLVKTLDSMGERGRRTTILITADHGRADNFRDHGPDSPESGRVFLIAAGGDVPAMGLVNATKKHHLADIAPTLRVILGLPPRPLGGDPIAEIVGDAQSSL